MGDEQERLSHNETGCVDLQGKGTENSRAVHLKLSCEVAICNTKYLETSAGTVTLSLSVQPLHMVLSCKPLHSCTIRDCLTFLFTCPCWEYALVCVDLELSPLTGLQRCDSHSFSVYWNDDVTF